MSKEKFAEIITEARLRLKISQSELARRIDEHQARISDWESAKSYPDTPGMLKLATALNLSIVDLAATEAAK